MAWCKVGLVLVSGEKCIQRSVGESTTTTTPTHHHITMADDQIPADVFVCLSICPGGRTCTGPLSIVHAHMDTDMTVGLPAAPYLTVGWRRGSKDDAAVASRMPTADRLTQGGDE